MAKNEFCLDHPQLTNIVAGKGSVNQRENW